MPIIGNLIAVGGFGYFASKIYANESMSSESKGRAFEKLLLGTGAGVGSSIGGAVVGSVLIPIPVLGALIGGFIGGLVGGTSTSILFEYMNEGKSREIVQMLE
jgi:phage tail tape-measure protein